MPDSAPDRALGDVSVPSDRHFEVPTLGGTVGYLFRPGRATVSQQVSIHSLDQHHSAVPAPPLGDIRSYTEGTRDY